MTDHRGSLLRWPTLGALVVAGAMAVAARGPAGDEEAAHYLIARFAPRSPELFVSLVGRPLVTLALTLPAQAGFLAARLASVLATALAAYATARVARRTGWLHPLGAVALLLIQPFFLAHAGTAMTEPWAAALVAVAILAYVERRMVLLALAAALLPLARLEAMVFWPLVIWALFRERRFGPMWLLALPLPLWNLGGWLASGDPLWLLHQTAPATYPQRSPFHYLQSLAWILGAGLPAPVLLGLFQAWRAYAGRPLGTVGSDETEEARCRALVVSAVVVIGGLLVYTALAWWQPVTFGNLRYVASAAPAIALLGAAGIRVILEQNRTWAWVVLGVTALVAFAVWSHPLLGDFTPLHRWDFFVGIATLPWLALYLLPLRLRRVGPVLAVALGVLGLVRYNANTLHLAPTPEQQAVRLAARMLARGVAGGVPIHTAHPLLAFYGGGNLYDDALFPPVTERTPVDAPLGSLLFWDSHYVVTRGPTLSLDSFLRSPGWRFLGGTVARDSTWAGAFFLRQDPSGAGPGGPSGLLSGPGLDRSAWEPLARLAESGVPIARAAAREDPHDPDRWLDLASLLGECGLGGEALAAQERAAALDPASPRGHAVRADLLRREGRLDEALEAIGLALAERPHDGDLHVIAARILLAAKRPDEAGRHLREAADRLSTRWDVQYAAGRFLFERGQMAEAEKRLSAAARLNPRQVEAAIFAARAQFGLGWVAEAEATLRELVRRRPEVPDGYVELGDLLYALHRENEARAVWREGAVATTGDEALARRVAAGTPPDPREP